MAWQAKFKYLEGWQLDEHAFQARQQAESYALGMATQSTKIIDFNVIETDNPVNAFSDGKTVLRVRIPAEVSNPPPRMQ